MKEKYIPKKECREDYHSFTIKTDECKHKHCSRCGHCQAIDGCLQIIKKTKEKHCEGCKAFTVSIEELNRDWNIHNPELFRKVLRILNNLHREVHLTEQK